PEYLALATDTAKLPAPFGAIADTCLQSGRHLVALIELGKREVATDSFCCCIAGNLFKFWINVFDDAIAISNDDRYRTLLYSTGKNPHTLFGSTALPAYFCFTQLSFDSGNQTRECRFIHEIVCALLKQTYCILCFDGTRSNNERNILTAFLHRGESCLGTKPRETKITQNDIPRGIGE